MRLALALAFAACALLFTACAGPAPRLRVESPYRDPATLEKGQILHLATGRLLTEGELIEYLAPYPVVYVGESHDSVDDHAVELAVLEGLAARFPGRVTLGMEMLRRPSQPEVDAYLRGDLDEKAFLRVWQENWGPRSFPYYRAILHFARDRGIPILALNAGNDLKEAVREKGIDGLDPEMTARLPEMDFTDPYHRAFIAGMFGGHAAGADHLDVFYRIQVLWDETMAETAAQYLAAHQGEGRHLVVIAGGNHVRYGFGIPRRVFRRAPLAYTIVDPYTVEIPEAKRGELMDVELPELPMRPADVYWAVGYEDLEGQRVMLGVQIEPAEGGGVRVVGVMPGSPAAKAGVEPQDVIVGIDGEPVKEIFDLTYQVGLHQPGDHGAVEVRRGEQDLTLELTYDVVKHGK